MIRTVITPLALALVLLIPAAAPAQSLGTFRWQLQPYCNVLTVTVVQDGGQYHLDGTDDQCGATRKASVVGLAFPNPDATIGFGFTIVTTPGGAPVHVDARISIATISGQWSDSAGGSGAFVFTPGAGTGGSARPAPTTAIPGTIRLQANGGLVAGGQVDVGPIPASGPGARMMWHPGKLAFRAGRVSGSQWDEASIGYYSTAFGQNNVASGFAAVAMGTSAAAVGEDSIAIGPFTLASGIASVALGWGTVASNGGATAMGRQTFANGPSSTAMGEGTQASGHASTALGGNTAANGNYSVAMGFGSTTTALFGFAGGNHSSAGDTAFAFGQDASALGVGSVALGRAARTTAAGPGSFMFADRSTSAAFQSNAPNEFGARFAGGYYFYTRADLGTGVAVAPNGSSWAALSDVNAKEHFREVDGEDLLARLGRVPVREWSYKAQGAAIRHMGPTAQDFRAAFGLGDFPLRINTIDADGVALAGVKALDARTRDLPDSVQRLRDENAALKSSLANLIEAMSEVRQQLEGLKARGGVR